MAGGPGGSLWAGTAACRRRLRASPYRCRLPGFAVLALARAALGYLSELRGGESPARRPGGGCAAMR